MVSHDIENSLAIADEALHMASTGQLESLPRPLVEADVVERLEADVLAPSSKQLHDDA
jgi:hypothetical protein